MLGNGELGHAGWFAAKARVGGDREHRRKGRSATAGSPSLVLPVSISRLKAVVASAARIENVRRSLGSLGNVKPKSHQAQQISPALGHALAAP
jgi:hypothetical protein